MSQLCGRLIDETSGDVFELHDLSAIGRNREAEIVISDPLASRRHAMIRRQDDGFWFFDLGGLNGSYLNGRRVTTSQLLSDGDILKIGNRQLLFRGSAPPSRDEGDTTVSEMTIVQMRSVDAVLLVSDIQNYTGLSEQLPTDEVAQIIGSWYERTQHIISSHGATLDKFIGDSVLAYWTNTAPETRRLALQCADALQRACEKVRQQHQEVLVRESLDFKSGAAIHLGPISYGPISSKQFTLLGDAVNVVFRLETLTRKLSKRVLVSAEFLDGWDEGRQYCCALGNQAVKGRAREVDVHALESSPPPFEG